MKRILLIVAIFTVLVVAGLGYWMSKTRGLSPKMVAETTDVKITYGSPQMRGRVLFGAAAANPVLIWGEYWRLGANEATEITTTKTLRFGPHQLEPGTYSIYAFPQPNSMKVVFNKANSRWGYSAPDADKDIFSIEAPVAAADSTAEGFVIAIQPVEGQQEIRFQWGDYLAVLPFEVAN
jgi:hypothetical protein